MSEKAWLVRLQMILPRVEPARLPVPTACPRCQSLHLTYSQEVAKPLRDTHHAAVTAHPYTCRACGTSFRVYSSGVDHHHTSQRTRGLGIMLYLLGLSYGATSLAREALDCYLAESTVYQAVQRAAEGVPGRTAQRTHLLERVRTEAMGADVASVKGMGEWMPLGMTVEDVSGLVLTLDTLEVEDAQTLRAWIAPVAETVGNLRRIGECIRTRDPGTAGAEIHLRYTRPPPRPGERAALAYQMRMRTLDRAATELSRERRPRLTRYRQWLGAKGQRIAGTDNFYERATGSRSATGRCGATSASSRP